MSGLAGLREYISKNKNSLEVKKETFRNVITAKIYEQMKQCGKSKADMAKLMGTSKPAVTTLLSGNRNFTIDKLVEIAFALNSEISITIQPPREKIDATYLVNEFGKTDRASSPLEYVGKNTKTDFKFIYSHRHHEQLMEIPENDQAIK